MESLSILIFASGNGNENGVCYCQFAVGNTEFVCFGFVCIMAADTNSSASVNSLEDKTEDFCENPTRDSLTEGLMYIIKSGTDQLDEKVAKLR